MRDKCIKEQQLNKDVVSGVILINKNSFNRIRVTVKVNIDLLKDDVIIKIKDDCIIIKKPSIDYRGKSYKMTPMKSRDWYQTALSNNIPLGKYYFDEEESNEDELVAYF